MCANCFTPLLLVSVALLIVCLCTAPAYGACDVLNCEVCMTNTSTMCSNCNNGYMLSDAYKCEVTTTDDSGDGVAAPCSVVGMTAALVMTLAALLH